MEWVLQSSFSNAFETILESFGFLILDILGEIAGGRGGPINYLPRYTLGAVIWFVLLVSALNAREREELLRDKLLIAGFAVGFARELLMLFVAVLELRGIVSASMLNLFFPPINIAMMLVTQSVIAAAFLHHFIKPAKLSRNFFFITVSLSAILYLVMAPLWWISATQHPELRFEDVPGVWLVHLYGAALVLFAIVSFLQERTWMRLVVSLTFTMYFGNHMLMLLNLATDQTWQTILKPIGNNLELWATPIFGFVYWREQRDKHNLLQAEIKQTERLELIGQLAAGVSHDFKNHLQVIKGYAELGHMQSHNSEKVEQCLLEISDTVERSSALVNQLLTFSRRDKLKHDVSVDVNDVVSELTPMLSQLLGPQFRLDFRLQADMPHAVFDTTELEQLIVNLVVNARDAQPDGGVIRLATTTTQKYRTQTEYGPLVRGNSSGGMKPSGIELSISDLGIGMTKEEKTRAFDPFFTTKAVGEGTGLGLSTVYGLVQKHGGQVKVDSELGQGTTVTVKLKLAEFIESEQVASAAVAVEGGNETVLLAEDDDSVRSLTTELLTQAGYKVYAAEDGRKAVELAERYQAEIDLLLFDVAMPKLNGYLTYEAISEFMPGLPAAFVSADPSRATANKSDYPHLAKPFTRAQLLGYVREQLNKRPNAFTDRVAALQSATTQRTASDAVSDTPGAEPVGENPAILNNKKPPMTPC